MKKKAFIFLILFILTVIVGIYAVKISTRKNFKPLTEKQALSSYIGGMRYQLLDYINDDTEGYTDAQLRDIGKAYKELSKYVSEVNIDRRAEVAEINKEREKTYERIGYIVWTVFIVLVIGLIISFINYYSDLSLIGR